MYCPAQLSLTDFTALFRPLFRDPLELPGLYEPKWRAITPKWHAITETANTMISTFCGYHVHNLEDDLGTF